MNLNSEIEKALGSPVRALRELGGGCVGEVHAATLANDERVVVKVDRRSAPSLDTEGFMLNYLAAHSQLPVPAVRYSSPRLLIMDFIAGTSAFAAQADGEDGIGLGGLVAFVGGFVGQDGCIERCVPEETGILGLVCVGGKGVGQGLEEEAAEGGQGLPH